MGFSDWVAVGSACLSVLALLINIIITTRQTRISVETFKFNNDTQVMGWANRVVAAMSEAYHLSNTANLAPQFLAQRSLGLSTALSALIDEGRWFFPNIGKKETDHPEKAGAYKGTRQAVLDHMVAVYDAVLEIGTATDKEALHGRIHEARRLFVTEVQHAVDPRRRAWIMDRFKKF